MRLHHEDTIPMGKGSECDPTIWIKEGMFKQTWLIKNLGFRAMKGFQSL